MKSFQCANIDRLARDCFGARKIHMCHGNMRYMSSQIYRCIVQLPIKARPNFIRTGMASAFIETCLVYFSVTITGASFKGFFLQARDSNTNEWIGSWAQTPNTKTHPECSAVTHADPREKEQATFIWDAPNARGNVYFTWVYLQCFRAANISWKVYEFTFQQRGTSEGRRNVS